MSTPVNVARLIAQARAVPIERELERRGIRLRGRVDRYGPCPVCGGTDRFSVNVKKQVWNCRGCGLGGDVSVQAGGRLVGAGVAVGASSAGATVSAGSGTFTGKIGKMLLPISPVTGALSTVTTARCARSL